MKKLLHKAVDIASGPGKIVSLPLSSVFERHYRAKRFARTLFVIDLVALAIIAISTAIILYFTVFRPPTILERVRVDANVAPTEVVSGDLSTLVIRYENSSEEDLRFARIQLTYPNHFSLQETPSDLTEIAPGVYDLGTIAAGSTGSIKLRGVMFGDVGGEQRFTSSLSFTYGPHNRTATKTSDHTFTPTRSTLVLKLTLPDQIVQGQLVRGQISYQNTGTFDLPQITVEPLWPESFVLVSTSVPLVNGQFILSSLAANQSGVIDFVGRLPNAEAAEFLFDPRFSFGEDLYKQDRLTHTVKLLPSQIKVTTNFTPVVVTPGGSTVVTINYEHVGELPIENLSIVIEANNQPLVKQEETVVLQSTTRVVPGDIGTTSMTLYFDKTLDSNTLTSLTNLFATFKTFVNYALVQDGLPPAEVSVLVSSDDLKITSPLILETFARYTSPQGDQIGRGSVPPTVGEETKYWVFMTVRGTSNDLENVQMEAELGSRVSFTGKQSISYGEHLSYEASENVITWSIGNLPATLSGDTVVSVAFEVALLPETSMVGTTPILLASPLISARDTWTGAFVTARGATITTDLPHDQLAAGLGEVVVTE